jgi:ABC-type taurine transport system substrate-binding protein
MVKFVKILAASDDNYRKNAAKWNKDSAETKAVCKMVGRQGGRRPRGHGAVQVSDGLRASDEVAGRRR